MAAASTTSANGSGSGSEGAQMSGYLRKKQKNGAKWKRLWFVLKDGLLYAFKAPEDTMPSDTFPILGYKLEILSEVRFFSLGYFFLQYTCEVILQKILKHGFTKKNYKTIPIHYKCYILAFFILISIGPSVIMHN